MSSGQRSLCLIKSPTIVPLCVTSPNCANTNNLAPGFYSSLLWTYLLSLEKIKNIYKNLKHTTTECVTISLNNTNVETRWCENMLHIMHNIMLPIPCKVACVDRLPNLVDGAITCHHMAAPWVIQCILQRI